MYKHCSTEEAVRRQRQIERCLLNMMRTVPYARITVGDLCQAADISRKSFYRYFGSKEDCLHALIDHSILDASSAYLSDTSPELSLQRIFEHYFIYWSNTREFLDALYQNGLTTALFERSMVLMAREDLELRHLLRSDACGDAREQMTFIITGIIGLILSWHLSGYQKTPADMATTMDRLLKNSLLAVSRRPGAF